MKLQYISTFFQNTGYGVAARGYARALRRIGVDFAIAALPAPDQSKAGQDLKPYEGFLSDATHVLAHIRPSDAMMYDIPRGKERTVLYTTWETWSFPDEFSSALKKKFDGFIVPSKVCARQMNGMTPAVVPHVLEREGEEAWPWPTPPRLANEFVFLWHGAWSERKNPIGALKAYWHAFSENEPVVFKLKIDKVDPALYSILEQMVGARRGKVELIREHLTQTELVQLYRSADAFVTLSRGEAWNLPAFHAASQGVPVIYTMGAGHAAFLGPGHYPVRGALTPVCSALTPLFSMAPDRNRPGQFALQASLSEPPGVNVTQLWIEPDLVQASIAMRNLFDDYGGSKEMPRPLEGFGAEAVADELVKAIGGSK